jgi:hypothetical protein
VSHSEPEPAQTLEAVPRRVDGPEVVAVVDRSAESLPGPFESLPSALLSALERGPLSGRALARRLGVRWCTTFAVLHELERVSAIKRIGKGRAAPFRRVDGG